MKAFRLFIKRYFQFDFTAKLFFLLAFILLIPIIIVVFNPDEAMHIISFVIPSLITVFIGLAISKRKKDTDSTRTFGRQQDTVIVVFIWFYAFIVGSLPFVISKQLPMLLALFESVSGWTTTGLSVIDVEATPNIFLFFRSLMQYCGGLGFVLLMLLFSGGRSAMQLFSAEGHTDRLEPNLRSTAKSMMLIYLGFTTSGSIIYIFLGMNVFDAITHAMAALSTGGFSTRTDSIGYFQSAPIEFATIILMLLGTTNFAILSLLLQGKFKTIRKIGELKFFFILLILSVPILFFAGLQSMYGSMQERVRIAVFQIVSALSTTGFSTITFNDWQPGMFMICIILMIIGGGSGSTAGGIKYSRVYIMIKSIIHNTKVKFLPERSVSEAYTHKSQGKIYLTTEYTLEISRFIFTYLVLFFTGTLIIALTGVSIGEAMFEFASALGTVGLSTGRTNSDSPPLILVTQILGMMLGRLEIFIVMTTVVSLLVKAKSAVLARHTQHK